MEDSKKSWSNLRQEQKDEYKDWAMLHMQHWRSWGSWFSWGSPVGLGLFVVLICVAIYILHLAGLIG